MNTLVNEQLKAFYSGGSIIVSMQSGLEIKFPVSNNPRLSKGTEAELNNIEVSPFGLHWPDLDEDLSFEGLQKGDFGQFQNP
jgi:hypothetical protein